MEQDFHSNFGVDVTRLFCVFSGLYGGIVLNRVWFERSSPARVTWLSSLRALKLMTSQVVQGTWPCAAGFGARRSQRVKLTANL